MTLGPGSDELTDWSSHWEVHVIGYDGTVRRTSDLSAVLDESSEGELAWSPDGRRLGFIEEQARSHSPQEESFSIQALSLLLPGPGQEGPGTARTWYDYATVPFDEPTLLWSPDGTRAAVRDPDQVLELSVEDAAPPGPAPLRVHHAQRLPLPTGLALEAGMSGTPAPRDRGTGRRVVPECGPMAACTPAREG